MDDRTMEQTHPAAPDSALDSLGRLVGTWKISGETQGQVRYERMEGNHFLLKMLTWIRARG